MFILVLKTDSKPLPLRDLSKAHSDVHVSIMKSCTRCSSLSHQNKLLFSQNFMRFFFYKKRERMGETERDLPSFFQWPAMWQAEATASSGPPTPGVMGPNISTIAWALSRGLGQTQLSTFTHHPTTPAPTLSLRSFFASTF